MLVRPRVWIPFVVALLLGVGVVVFRLRSVVHADAEAREVLRAGLDGNVDYLFAHEHPIEQAKLHMTREKVEALWKELVGPRLLLGHADGPVVTNLDADGAEGVASQSVRVGNGLQSEVEGIYWEGEGSSGTMLMNFLDTAWIFDYAVSRGHGGFTDQLDARLQGVRHDRATLERIGIPGLIRIDNQAGTMSLETWDQYELGLSKAIASFRGQGQDHL